MKVKIIVEKNLDESWSSWFEDFKLKHEGKHTQIEGKLADQSELHGILNKIRDLNLKLLSVDIIEDTENN